MPDLYLLHFDPPYEHARHYLGYSTGTGRGKTFAKRVAKGDVLAHELPWAAVWAGCNVRVAEILDGAGRREQRRMRAAGSLSRFCPICRETGCYHR